MALLNETGLSYLWGKIKALLNGKADVGHKHSYNDLDNKPTIPTMPTALSQLSQDSTHRVVTDTEKSTWNAKSNFSGSYNDLTNKPSIPSAYTHPSTHPSSMITGLSTVATSGSYNDLSNKPTIPTVPSSLPANGGNADTVDGYHIRTGTSGASGYITFVV